MENDDYGKRNDFKGTIPKINGTLPLLRGDTLQQETQRLNTTKMYSNMHVLVDLPMIRFYCKAKNCKGKFLVAKSEQKQLVMANAHTCPICGEFCVPSKFRNVRI